MIMSSERKERLLARALRLAKVYGPFVRFDDIGTEGVLDETIKDGEKVERSPEDQSAIDKSRHFEQQAEQEASNAARARDRASQAESDLASQQSENESLKDQLAAAKAEAAEAGIEDIKLDAEDFENESDRALVGAIHSLNEKIKATNKSKDERIKGLEKTASDYKSQLQADNATSAKNAAYDELLTDLDTEYGADCRNEAVAKFQTAAKSQTVPLNSPAKATRFMEKCYKEAKAAKDKIIADNLKEGKIPLDTGSGGGSAPNLSGTEIPDGLSLDDAVKHLDKAGKT